MAEIKVTQEIIDAIGLSRPNLIKMIREGTKKGTVTDKTIMLDESEVPEAFKPKSINAPIVVDKRQEVLDNAETIKAETARIRAEIDLATAKGERDKPEKLAQKEKDLITLQQTLEKRQTDLDVRENSLTVKSTELDGREKLLAQREQELVDRKIVVDTELAGKIEQNKKEAAKILADAENQKQVELDNKDGELLQRQEELDGLNKEVNKHKKALEELHKEWDTVIIPMQKELNDMVNVANRYASYHYSNGDKTQSKVQDYHYSRANYLWKIKDKAETFLKRLVK